MKLWRVAWYQVSPSLRALATFSQHCSTYSSVRLNPNLRKPGRR